MKQDYTKAQSGRRNILLVSALLFTAWMCRLPFLSISPSPYLSTALGLLRPFIYIGLCAGWSASISGKIISRQLRFYLNAMAVCCIIWLFLRTVKFELTVNGDLLNLILVHGFNFCFILIPTFGFFASLYEKKRSVPHSYTSTYFCIRHFRDCNYLCIYKSAPQNVLGKHRRTLYARPRI